mmetsp:Transcript_73656/g.123011  ORF Transcript_73656/g.123011 Transcript_73656/m.123011 type:complete len:405 (-) Transcript_73656:384-1598(-)
MQGGKKKEEEREPISLVVGVGKGKCRFTEEQMEQVHAIRLSLHMNIAASALKIGELHGSKDAAAWAVKLAPNTPKPLFRLAQAQNALHDHKGAVKSLTDLLELTPENTAARNLLDEANRQEEQRVINEKKAYAGMFDRSKKDLYSAQEVEEQQQREREKTQYARNREEEKRRGVQMIDTKELSRTPADYQQTQIDEMNASMENEAQRNKVPRGMTEKQYKKLIQMRTDGKPEEEVQEEMQKMRYDMMEQTKKGMLREEIEQMGALYQAMERDRYKSDDIVQKRQDEYDDRFEEIKKRVEIRLPMMKAHKRVNDEKAAVLAEALEDPTVSEQDKAYKIREYLHHSFQDLDDHLRPNEMERLEELKSRPNDPTAADEIQALLLKATERRIEERVDEILNKEDEVLV